MDTSMSTDMSMSMDTITTIIITSMDIDMSMMTRRQWNKT
jgi:hypothetical protein